MAQDIVLQASTRDESGSSEARRMRRAGTIPAILGRIDEAPKQIKLESHAFEMMLRHHQSESLIVDLIVDGDATPIKALMKDVQHDSLTGEVLHADFKEISMTETLQVRMSVRLIGEPTGVKNQGGILEQTMHEVEVEGRPDALVEAIELDVTELELGTSLHASDLTMPEGVVLVTDSAQVVATVMAPRVETAASGAEGEEGDAGEATAEGSQEKSGD